MDRFTAVYVRVSSPAHGTQGQVSDLTRWTETQTGQACRWYRDHFRGAASEGRAIHRLLADLEAGHVARIVVWRLDRLGLTVKALNDLFATLTRRKVDLISLKEDFRLATASGRVAASVLASLAAYEKEVRAERIKAGQAVARKEGKRWGGSKKGRRLKVTDQQIATIRRLRLKGQGVTAIARAAGLSRPTVYRLIATHVPSRPVRHWRKAETP